MRGYQADDSPKSLGIEGTEGGGGVFALIRWSVKGDAGMNHIRNLGGAVALMMICAAAPCLAQTPAPPPANSGTASISPSTPSGRNPVLADNGDSRTSKVVGSDVYNEQDKKLGSVDDVLLGQGGTNPKAVLSVDGKLVEVPYGKLEFGDTKQSSHNRVILRGETVDSLKKMAAFHYRKT